MPPPSRIHLLASYLASGLFAYALGFRGYDLLLCAAVIWVAVFFAMIFFKLVLIPLTPKPIQPDFLTLNLANGVEKDKGEADASGQSEEGG